jgi:hypothetical protein
MTCRHRQLAPEFARQPRRVLPLNANFRDTELEFAASNL